MGKKLHVVPHSHWDREWYFTTSRSKVYLMKDLADVLDVLESKPDFKTWMLDGQASLLDDYLAWRPQDEERIKMLVGEGRLIIGPWYTQTDQMIISGESIVRNLTYGMRRCEDFGPYMNVGYMPDSFGQAGNMPQIYRAAGIEDTLFWRGVSNDMAENLNYTWRGDDGSTVFATQMPTGYYIGGNMPEDSELNDTWWHEQVLDKLAPRHVTENVYFPCGFDQAPVRANLPELIAARNEYDPANTYCMSSLPQYIAETKAAIERDGVELEEVTGELLNAKHMRIHRTIWSSRSDLKKLNTQVQNYVTNVLEPLLALSSSLGNDYPRHAVDHIWKLLFENAAHDSIGSCIADAVNEDVYLRYKQASDIATSLVELHSRLIATSVDNGGAPMTFTVFNTLPKTRSGVVIKKMYIPGPEFTIVDEKGAAVSYTVIESRDLTEYVLSQTVRLDPSAEIFLPKQVLEATVAIEAREVPALGYVQYRLVTEGSTAAELVQTSKDSALENEFYRITVNANGSLRIEDKVTGTVYDNQAVLEENGDDGDSFNYSPPREDVVVRSDGAAAPVISLEKSSIYGRAEIVHTMLVPASLEERAQGVCSTELPVTLTVGLRRGSRVIDINVHVENTVGSHRLCILFDAQMATRVNYADQQFGAICRENVHAEDMALYEAALAASEGAPVAVNPSLPANWRQNMETWQEPSVSIEPTQSYVALSDGTRGLAVFPLGVREYEIVGEEKGQIRLTIFRSYGFMGRENLLYRPGRASGERTMETPDAQLIGSHDFQLGLMSFAETVDAGRVAEEARSYDGELQVYEYAEFLNGRLIFSEPETVGTRQSAMSLFELEGTAIVSAVKAPDDPSMPGVIVRLFNGFNELDATAIFTFGSQVKKAYLCDLRERYIGDVEVDGCTVRLDPLAHCKFATVYVECESH